MAGDLPPLRSLRDFLTDAQFTTPTFNDPERMSNRMANNLLYYQTNYFLLAIVVFVIVGCMHPKDFCLGALSLVAAVYLYRTLTSRKGRQTLHKYSNWRPLLVPGVVLGLLVILNLLSSIMVFVFGVVMPIGVSLFHSASRKRNLKNKFTNILADLKDDTTPMGLILSKLYQLENDLEQKAESAPQ